MAAKPKRGPLAGTEVETLVREPSRQDRFHDSHGREIPDPMPLAPPIGYKRQPTLAEQIKSMVRSEQLAREAASQGYETFDEADDFDVEDGFDPQSPYEENFDPPPQWHDPADHLAKRFEAALEKHLGPSAGPSREGEAPPSPESHLSVKSTNPGVGGGGGGSPQTPPPEPPPGTIPVRSYFRRPGAKNDNPEG